MTDFKTLREKAEAAIPIRNGAAVPVLATHLLAILDVIEEAKVALECCRQGDNSDCRRVLYEISIIERGAREGGKEAQK